MTHTRLIATTMLLLISLLGLISVQASPHKTAASKDAGHGDGSSAGINSVDSQMFEAVKAEAHKESPVVDVSPQTKIVQAEDKLLTQPESPSSILMKVGAALVVLVIVCLIPTCGSAAVCALAYHFGNAVRGSRPSIG